MRSTSEPAYRTLTGPDPLAEADAEAEVEELLLAGEEELDELEELQPAAASAAHTSATAAALRGIRP
jgi:hypothetical protein